MPFLNRFYSGFPFIIAGIAMNFIVMAVNGGNAC
ncbi:DUF5317 family protein [Effusibacillus dendaii]